MTRPEIERPSIYRDPNDSPPLDVQKVLSPTSESQGFFSPR